MCTPFPSLFQERIGHVQFTMFSLTCSVAMFPLGRQEAVTIKKNAFSRNFSKYNCKTLDILVQISNIYQSKAYILSNRSWVSLCIWKNHHVIFWTLHHSWFLWIITLEIAMFLCCKSSFSSCMSTHMWF